MNTETQIPENETIAQKAYRLLSPIPAEQWCVGYYSNEKRQCCAIGHWTRLHSADPNDYSEDNCWENDSDNLRKVTQEYMSEKHGYTYVDIAAVNNDSQWNGYNEPVTKDRVMHLLTDMIAAGY